MMMMMMRKNKTTVRSIESSNLERLSFQRSMELRGHEVAQCTSQDVVSSPTHYGGGELRPDAHIDILPRRSKLPSRKNKFEFHDDRIRTAFLEIYDEGSFVIAWKHTKGHHDDNHTTETTSIHVGICEAPKQQTSLGEAAPAAHFFSSGSLLVIKMTILKDLSTIESHSVKRLQVAAQNIFRYKVDNDKVVVIEHGSAYSSSSSSFASGISHEGMNYLASRVLHHFLRQHGSSLPFSALQCLHGLAVDLEGGRGGEAVGRGARFGNCPARRAHSRQQLLPTTNAEIRRPAPDKDRGGPQSLGAGRGSCARVRTCGSCHR